MALQQEIVDKRFGLNVPGAYIKLVYVSWSDITLQWTAVCSVFASQEASLNESQVIDTLEVQIDTVSGIDPRPAIYNKIKNLPEFAGAIDV